MDNEGPRTTPPDANTTPASPGNAPGTSPPDDAKTNSSQPEKGAPPRPNPWRRPVELVALIAWLTLIILVQSRSADHRMRGARNSAHHATISDLSRALEYFAIDHGTYPSRANAPLVGDTTFFVQCLRSNGPRGVPYYTFRDDDIVNGEFLSAFGKPFRYTFPAKGQPGPDGLVRDKLDFYLWTWGWEGYPSRDSNDPPSEWGVNNWSR
jgi:hypothetical protein